VGGEGAQGRGFGLQHADGARSSKGKIVEYAATVEFTMVQTATKGEVMSVFGIVFGRQRKISSTATSNGPMDQTVKLPCEEIIEQMSLTDLAKLIDVDHPSGSYRSD
jgi:hypothetical protein